MSDRRIMEGSKAKLMGMEFGDNYDNVSVDYGILMSRIIVREGVW